MSSAAMQDIRPVVHAGGRPADTSGCPGRDKSPDSAR